MTPWADKLIPVQCRLHVLRLHRILILNRLCTVRDRLSPVERMRPIPLGDVGVILQSKIRLVATGEVQTKNGLRVQRICYSLRKRCDGFILNVKVQHAVLPSLDLCHIGSTRGDLSLARQKRSSPTKRQRRNSRRRSLCKLRSRR